MSYISPALEKQTSYVTIIEEFEDGLCRYGFHSENGDFILRTVGKTEIVKKNSKCDDTK